MARKLPIAVLISGSGTNLQAIIDAAEANKLDAEIRLVLSNRGDAYGLTRARQHGLTIEVIDHRQFRTREEFDSRVVDLLTAAGVELVCLAGFMRLISPVFIRAYSNRIMNIHPALLPAFTGLNAQRQAADYGVRFAGCTVHFVNEECDQGPIIIQAVVPSFSDDTEETLAARILKQEHIIYPRAIQLYSEGRLRVEGRKVFVTGINKRPEQVIIEPAVNE